MEFIKQLLANDYFVVCAMAVIIFGLTQLLKLPIKAATKHIKNENTRGVVNLVILIIPFGLGLLAEFLFDVMYLHNDFTGIAGLQYGSSSLLVYSVFEKIAKKIGSKVKIKNPYKETEEGKAVVEFVEGVINSPVEKSVETADKEDAVQDFWDNINK